MKASTRDRYHVAFGNALVAHRRLVIALRKHGPGPEAEACLRASRLADIRSDLAGSEFAKQQRRTAAAASP